jgi:hypothetical protein
MSNVYVVPRPTIKVPKLVEDDEHRPVIKPVDLPKPDPVGVDEWERPGTSAWQRTGWAGKAAKARASQIPARSKARA